jgi:hypothetical protein
MCGTSTATPHHSPLEPPTDAYLILDEKNARGHRHKSFSEEMIGRIRRSSFPNRSSSHPCEADHSGALNCCDWPQAKSLPQEKEG